MSDRYDELEQLKRLLDQGAITEEEFQAEKAKILAGDGQSAPPPAGPPPTVGANHWGMEEHTFCMLMHLSQFAAFLIPVVGYALPIVMWATEKNKSATIDAHGRILLNYLISYTIYTIASFILCFILIGIPVLIALVIVSFVFPIIASIKANQGKLWKYPLCIRFFRVSSPSN